MNKKSNQSKLRQLDKFIVKAKRNFSPVTTQVQFETTQTNEHKQSELERKAREEILKDAALGVRRYEAVGPQGWKKPACLKTNKKFLERILRATRAKSNAVKERLHH
ncbi:unnamed protein product [Litomosoides sigmodontis]|uniref:Uncharacterized protein n=1 Tax=Litomosoides sigmodontis TaxID=42156 RepID=A0A3P6T3Z8_LITSI|nr:unnamed protein product [Litomosoides sigmodontis]